MDYKVRETIKDYKAVLKAFPIVLQAAKQFDGKILNKRFSEFVSDYAKENNLELFVNYGTNSYNKSTHQLYIVSVEVGSKFPILDILSVEPHGILVDKWFNYDRFKSLLENRKKFYETELNKLIEDFKTGEDRINQYNQLIEQAQSLLQGFSQEFLDIHRYDFKKARF